jgi:hypothetical protein
MRRAFLAAALFVVTPTAASAEWQSLPSRAIILAGSPVELIETDAYRWDDKTSILSCVGFVNHSLKTATAIKIRIFQVDSFMDVETYQDYSIEGTFSTDVRIKIKRALNGMPNDSEGRCLSLVLYASQTKTIVPRIEKVLFSDGSVWESPLMGHSKPLGR